MQDGVRLNPIYPEMVWGCDEGMSNAAAELLRETAKLYATVGFVEPWIAYLAMNGDTPVGTCAFKSPPVQGRVEIAYHTFPEFEGRGYATAMARELIAISERHDAAVIIAAQTLPARCPSHRVLEKLGFLYFATLDHPDDGEVWEWRRVGSRHQL